MESSSTIMEEEQVGEETMMPPAPPTAAAAYPASHYGGFTGTAFPMGLAPVVLPPMASGERPTKPIRPTPILPVPPYSKMANLNLKEKASPPLPSIEPLPLSLKLPPPPPPPPPKDQSPATSGHSSPSSSSSSAFQAMSAGNFSGGGDSIISVA